VEVLDEFLAQLRSRNCSPNTVAAYAYDPGHFWRFLTQGGLDWRSFRPRDSLELLGHLREMPARGAGRRLGLALIAARTGGRAAGPAAGTSERQPALTAVSSFFDFTIIARAVAPGDT